MDLALERDALFSIDEFRTLNRCLDNAIADAVTEFSFQRDAAIAHQQSADSNERLGFLMHELRDLLNAATLAVHAIDSGGLTMAGATGTVLKRSHAAMGKLVDRSLAEVRSKRAPPEQPQIFSLTSFIAEARDAANLDAKTRGCTFTVTDVDPLLGVDGNRDLLLAALANLPQNAFKFTRPHTEVTLNAYAQGDRILVDVKDNCGGLPPGNVENIFTPFTQRSEDKTGLGLGLSIARQSVTADGGVLSVSNMPGIGCTFTISLPRCILQWPTPGSSHRVVGFRLPQFVKRTDSTAEGWRQKKSVHR
jgi:signal transduction histidine kinase